MSGLIYSMIQFGCANLIHFILVWKALNIYIHIMDSLYYVFCKPSLIFYLYLWEVPTQIQNIGILCVQILPNNCDNNSIRTGLERSKFRSITNNNYQLIFLCESTPLPGRALCLLTLGHISAYNMDSTILLYNYSTISKK